MHVHSCSVWCTAHSVCLRVPGYAASCRRRTVVGCSCVRWCACHPTRRIDFALDALAGATAG
jgi:hypothetical protein